MLARLSAFTIWALVAASAMFWGLRLFVRAPLAPASALAVNDTAWGAGRSQLARLLGAEEVAVATQASTAPQSSRFKLIGIMAGKAREGGDGHTPGLALISIDGKPPRTFAAGASLDEALVVQSLSLKTASVGPAQGPAAFVLEAPPLSAATTGVLPPPTGATFQSNQPNYPTSQPPAQFTPSMPPTMAPAQIQPPPQVITPPPAAVPQQPGGAASPAAPASPPVRPRMFGGARDV